MTGATFRSCVVIPSHDHWQALPEILNRLREMELPVFIIDDGSGMPAQAVLAALADPQAHVEVHRLEVNRGKGAAVIEGFTRATAAGFSHCLQIDADGQHDLTALPTMLALGRQQPDAVIAGQAVYDESAPLGRVVGRWITHVCVWLETLSFDIKDSMCGLRLYPLTAVTALLARGKRPGARMDFDTDILVRLHRAGTPVVNHPVHVAYPPGNLSNFRMVADNVRISAMHTRLIAGMVFDLPAMIWRRSRHRFTSTHWAGLAERGFYWGLRLATLAYRLLGRRGCLAVLAPVVLYFYLTSGEQRRASRDFLSRAFAARGQHRQAGWWDGYWHFLSFARRALDSFIAWSGRMPADTVVAAETSALEHAKAQPRGAVFIVCHHGNVEVSRALLDPGTRRRVIVLVHTRHAENYNRVLREFNPEAAVNMLQVTEMGPDTAIALQQQIDEGKWLFIAGDRTPVVGGGRRTSSVPFLGANAEFSQGPYLMAALLDCPVYLFFCSREGEHYGLRVESFAERILLPRGQRPAALAGYAAAYAARLEQHVLADPRQWYNFYDFWQPSQPAVPS